MVSASRSFRRQVAKKANVLPVVEFTLDWVDDDDPEKVLRSDTFHATQPSEERLFLLAAAIGSEDATGSEEAAAVLDIFRSSLPREEFRTLRERLRDPEDDVNIDMLQDVLMWLMGEWSDFPTEPSGDSLESPPTSGARSTGRVRGQGSTR